MSTIEVRTMKEADLLGADELRRLAGWNQAPEDWRRNLGLCPEGCFVAVSTTGQILGTVTTMCYQQTMAWIGLMLVHPDQRRQGLGTRLMRHALDWLEKTGIQCVKLDATPAGQPVYARLGFVPESTLNRWRRPGPRAVVLPGEVEIRAVCAGDLAAIGHLDARAFGISRLAVIESLIQQSRVAFVCLRGARVCGWGLLRPGAVADYLGPIVALSSADGCALAKHLLQRLGDRPVVWDVLDDNKAARVAVEELGFQMERPLVRMRLGPNLVKSESCLQFAIADPSVG